MKILRAETKKISSHFSRFYEWQSARFRCVNFQPIVCPDGTKS
ncbi:DUF1661 domain-containing protein [Porphyromonas gulae]|nr:DUF1661 domain-containing protein [Porphyromonas gulae]